MYAFTPTTDGFYALDFLADITDHVRVVDVRTDGMEMEIDAGKEYAGKTLLLLAVQYYNYSATPLASTDYLTKEMDLYADIPLGGVLIHNIKDGRIVSLIINISEQATCGVGVSRIRNSGYLKEGH